MLREVLGALEFVTFLGGLAWLCYRIERMPWYRRLNAKLVPEVNDDAQLSGDIPDITTQLRETNRTPE